jgi:hypothetical protein
MEWEYDAWLFCQVLPNGLDSAPLFRVLGEFRGGASWVELDKESLEKGLANVHEDERDRT